MSTPPATVGIEVLYKGTWIGILRMEVGNFTDNRGRCTEIVFQNTVEEKACRRDDDGTRRDYAASTAGSFIPRTHARCHSSLATQSLLLMRCCSLANMSGL